jgi:DNA mismatch repair protein MutL
MKSDPTSPPTSPAPPDTASEPRIRVMPDQLANQIAAGEVVERPSSVVKELVENSLDAEATRVEVEIEAGGTTLVRVTDDGTGMTAAEALLALKRHATSKIRSVADLRAIHTLGFRGEALPSIASVSQFELETRTRDRIEGVRVVVSGDGEPRLEAAGVPAGTRITVRELFYNVPARRKFLRAVATEAGRVSAELTRFALCYPHVHLRLVHNGRKVLDVAPERSLLNRVFAVLGRGVATRLHPVSLAMGIEVEGLVSDPGLHRPSADGAMFTFVNGRFIRDRLVQHAVTAAYGNLIDRGRYPYVVLFLRAPPTEVDVNVHPAKSEVRFVKSGEVHEAIVRAIRLTLADAPWLKPGAGRPAAAVPPVPAAAAALLAAAPRATQAALPLAATVALEDAPADVPPDVAVGAGAFAAAQPSGAPRPALGQVLRELEFRDDGAAAPGAPAGHGHGHDPRPTGAGAGAGAETPGTAGGFFARMRYIGQAGRLFLLCETPDALHVIDQHAAHERVTYERLRTWFREGGTPMQNLLFPAQLDVTPEEVQAVTAAEDVLARMGFDVACFGERTLAVRAVPALLSHVRTDTLVRDLVAELAEHGRPRALEDRVDAIAARMACHGSVRGGDLVTPQEAQELLKQLDRVDYRANCPHGRPVVVSHPFPTVARWFDRT